MNAFRILIGLALVASVIGCGESFTAHQSPTSLQPGQVIEVVGDDFAGQQVNRAFYVVEADGSTTRLNGDAKDFEKLVRRRGPFGQDAFSSPGVARSELVQPATVSKLLLIQINFTNDRTNPMTVAQWRSAVFTGARSTKVAYSQSSYGKFNLTSVTRADGDAAGPYALNMSSDPDCDIFGWAEAADAKAIAAGFDLNAYTHVAYVFPNVPTCGFAGASDMARRIWINGGPEHVNLNVVVAHELGHGLGFGHATDWVCTNATGGRVALNGNCVERYEYGDPYSPMGSGFYQFDAPFREGLGWYAAGRVQNVKANGTFTLRPIEATNVTTGPQVLKLQRDAKTNLYIEFRKPTGLDAFVDPSVPVKMNGLKITLAENVPLIGNGEPTYRTHLVDTTPGSKPFAAGFNMSHYDAVLTVGRSITDGAVGTIIQAVALDAAGNMQVKVTLGADTLPPVAPTLSHTVTGASTIALSWTAANDNRSVSGYRVYRNGVLIVSLASSARSYTDTTATNNATLRYAYHLTAFDPAGNVSAPSNLVGTGDVTPPAAPEELWNMDISGSNVTMAWPPSASADVAGYRLYRNGVLVATTTATTYVDVVSTTPGSVYSYRVSAVDAVGNESPLSIENVIPF